MSSLGLPDLTFLYARLHQQELWLCMRECHSRRLSSRSGLLRPVMGACLTALGRTVLRLGEWVRGTPTAAGHG